MRVAIKFFRVDAILDENKFNTSNLEVSFLFDFTPQSVRASLAPFDFASRNAPEIRPFVGPNHEYLASRVENQAADSDNRRMGFLESIDLRSQVQLICFENFAQLAQVLDNHVWFSGAQLV